MKRLFEFLSRLREPALFVLIAGGLWGVREFGLIPERWRPHADIAAQFLVIAAIGWALTSLLDLTLKRHIQRLELKNKTLGVRRDITRIDVFRRIAVMIGALATLAAALTVVPWARQIGVSLFASAGIAGIAVGIAARPVLANLIAGLQIAFTQPVKLDDVVVVEGEWGWVEEISLFFVVVRTWDLRRLVVPLSHIIEKPFENWSRRSTRINGAVYFALDYEAPVEEMREKLQEICKASRAWDGNFATILVTDARETHIIVRALASAGDADNAWILRCEIREQMISWLRSEYPEALPRLRADAVLEESGPDSHPKTQRGPGAHARDAGAVRETDEVSPNR